MSTALQTRKEAASSIVELLTARAPHFEAALPAGITPAQLIRVAMTSALKTPKLLECSPSSWYSALMEAAALGLLPDGRGHAYLVPRKGQVQLMPGYKGLMELAYRSGDVALIEPQCVFEGDVFDFRLGSDPMIEHKPTFETDTLTHVYAIATMRGGQKAMRVMSVAEVEARRVRSQAQGFSPWKTDYNAMAMKTVLRDLTKFLPSTIELQRAVAMDEAQEAGIEIQYEGGQEAPEVEVAPVE